MQRNEWSLTTSNDTTICAFESRFVFCTVQVFAYNL